jgi:hypothetical protein
LHRRARAGDQRRRARRHRSPAARRALVRGRPARRRLVAPRRSHRPGAARQHVGDAQP